MRQSWLTKRLQLRLVEGDALGFGDDAVQRRLHRHVQALRRVIEAADGIDCRADAVHVFHDIERRLCQARFQRILALAVEVSVTDERGVTVRLVYPVLTVMSDPPRLINGGSGPSWELVCEEV